MSIFDKISRSLGLSSGSSKTSASSGGKGHVLGRGEAPAPKPSASSPRGSGAPANEVFDVEFPEEMLGMVLRELENGRPVVDEVVPGGCASKLGVREGDLVIGIAGNVVESYSGLLQVIGAIDERPLPLRFSRPTKGGGGLASPRAASSSSSSSMRSMFAAKAAPPPPLSKEEIESRRAIAAAKAQERGSAWDKRVAASSAKKRGDAASGGSSSDGRPTFEHESGPASAETLRTVAAAKRAEEANVRALGFNPYQPHMSFSGSGAASSGVALGSATATATAGSAGAGAGAGAGGAAGVGAGVAAMGARRPDEDSGSGLRSLSLEEGDADPDLAEAVDAALSQLVALAASEDEQRVTVAIATTRQMLERLKKSARDDPKPRKIRVNNESFSARVAQVAGALDLFLAAGFGLVMEVPDGGSAEEAYLLHPVGDGRAAARLDYTLARLAQLS